MSVTWWVLVRHEQSTKEHPYPPEGVPISIHWDKAWLDRQADGKRYKVVPIKYELSEARQEIERLKAIDTTERT